MSTGGVPGLQDGEWEEVSDCSGGGVLNGEFGGEKIQFLITDKFFKIFLTTNSSGLKQCFQHHFVFFCLTPDLIYVQDKS